MANICQNELIISGNKQNIKDVVIKLNLKKETFNFSSFLPYPKKFAELDKKAEEHNKKTRSNKWIKDAYNNGGLKWCQENWGVSAEPDSVYVCDIKKNKLIICFDTKWNAPEEFIKNISTQYPRLKFKIHYEEPSLLFIGEFLYVNGELIKSKYEKFKTTKTYYKKSTLNEEEDEEF